ncbi:glucosaminidase domain-containing protein [Actinosynnema sp. NPDC004786]
MKLLGTARLLVIAGTLALSTLGSFAHAAPTDPTRDAPLTTAATQADYWAAAEPRARAVKAEYDIPASVAAAQAAHESAYGASSLAAQYNNHFGMKCVSATDPGPIAVGCRAFNTEECQPTCGPTTAYFRVYASMTDSFRDYGRLLTTSSYYAHALPYRHDPREFIRRVAERYATDPNYANKIIAMMDANNLYRFDVGGPERQAYPMYHQVRGADGGWTGFRALPGYQTTLPGDAKDVAVAAMADGSAQVVVVGADDVVYHQVRHADTNWTGFQPLSGNGTTTPAKAKAVSITGLADNAVQVVIVGWDDKVYHQTRTPDGNWTGFQPVPGMDTPTPAAGKDVAIAALPDGSAQLVIVGHDDGLYHQVLRDGTWSGFRPLAGTGTTAPAKGKRVSIAGTAEGAHVLVVGWDDRIYHQIRDNAGDWTGFQPLNGMDTTLPATGKDVAIGAHADGTAQVLVIGNDDGMYHRVRSGASWTPFRMLTGTDGTQAKGSRVAISAHPDNTAQVVVTGR